MINSNYDGAVTNLAFIVNNYSTKTKTEFTTEVADLLRGSIINTSNGYVDDVTADIDGRVVEEGTYAGDVIKGKYHQDSDQGFCLGRQRAEGRRQKVFSPPFP